MKIWPVIAARLNKRALDIWARSHLPQSFSVAAAQDQQSATEILLYDYIGYGGITAEDFVVALAKAGDGPIVVRINSPGGDVFDGMAIYNALRARTSPVKCVVDGLAASAASFIALAGSSVEMGEMSMLMVHKAWGFTIGNDDDHLEQAALLSKIDGQLAETYAKKTGKSAADMLAVMKAETWFTSTEAKANGLCDVILTAPAAPAAVAAKSGPKISALRASVRMLAAALPSYDPDGDGDNDAEEALGMINAASVLLGEAIDCLTGMPDADDAGEGDATTGAGGPIVPGASSAAANDAATAAAAVEAAATAAALEVSARTKQARQRRLRLAEAESA